MMGKRIRLGSPKSLWILSPLPSPKGRYRFPSASKYDMFSTTATQGTTSLANILMPLATSMKAIF